jgi:hypothetical protein
MDATILTRLTANLSEIIVYDAIALVTLVGLCKCIYPLLRNAALLNRAVIKLEKNTAAGERPLWREARFLGRSLRNDWQQFLLNAVLDGTQNEKEVLGDAQKLPRTSGSILW